MKYSKGLHEQLRKRDKDSDSAYVQCLLDEIERLQALSRWIPVGEGLPKMKQSDSIGYWGHTEDVNYDATLWMPFPEHPEDKQ